MLNSMIFYADWNQTWTAKEAEHQLIDFKFNGPGWYHEKDDTILVIPVNSAKGFRQSAEITHLGSPSPWNQKWSENQQFTFYIFNSRNPRAIFEEIALAPSRTIVTKEKSTHK